jgi:hypothetical protein
MASLLLVLHLPSLLLVLQMPHRTCSCSCCTQHGIAALSMNLASLSKMQL